MCIYDGVCTADLAVASISRFCEAHSCKNPGCWRPIANVLANHGCWHHDDVTMSCKEFKLYESDGLDQERNMVLDEKFEVPSGEAYVNTSLRQVRYVA